MPPPHWGWLSDALLALSYVLKVIAYLLQR